MLIILKLSIQPNLHFGRYYKFDIPATVKADVPAGADIENTAAQVVNYYNPVTKKVEKTKQTN